MWCINHTWRRLCSSQGGTWCPGHSCTDSGSVLSSLQHCMMPADCEPDQHNSCDPFKCCDCTSIKSCWKKGCDNSQQQFGSEYTEYIFQEDQWTCSPEDSVFGVRVQEECKSQTKAVVGGANLGTYSITLVLAGGTALFMDFC